MTNLTKDLIHLIVEQENRQKEINFLRLPSKTVEMETFMFQVYRKDAVARGGSRRVPNFYKRAF